MKTKRNGKHNNEYMNYENEKHEHTMHEHKKREHEIYENGKLDERHYRVTGSSLKQNPLLCRSNILKHAKKT